MAKTKKTKAAYAPPPEPATFSFETFRKMGHWETSNLTQREPSCFNGFVTVVRYRVTVERIEEPNEVLAARLLKLWRESDNGHHREPLKRAAQAVGCELNYSDYGVDAKRRD